ncbi:MAG: DNA primase [Flavobacteriaceae bacterium]|nr:DNA primase [Flavobacteriaceae bacterium]MDO7582475.1 DNA primase [Flavobacteriaceae bacterium]MDO7591778.1 DNA primase [Flavobacteriaceae bacterium]MDO7599526.1 DNA primase [Flavobacteriaceae bacterium]MDO7602711.1 DNA primase [Flavobacteriaceae bacterium]
MISKNTIDQVYETARVEEVIGDFVGLKKSGTNFKGLSPFTQERSPSFMVSPVKQIWKDFSSGKGGNVVAFLMEHEHFSYPEAIRYLAKKYNIEIEETEQTDAEKEKLNERESMFLVAEHANSYFKETLWEASEGKAIGLTYFKERGFTDETIKKFDLGYSPQEKDAFSKSALKNGFQLDFLEKTGLTIINENYQVDRFRGRVMFPIKSLSGRVVGFGGRILGDNKKTAKYLNSPESEIYHKSKVLYGIYEAKQSIAKEDVCYLVEGYTDVIQMVQSGVTNVVSSSGTALTELQIRLIQRLTQNIVVLFDGDAAGLRASLRGIDMILAQGMNVRVCSFPEGEDPDSFAKKNSQEAIELFFKDNSKDFIQFKASLLLRDAVNDPVKKAATIRDIVESISKIPDPIQQEVYVQSCAQIMDISENVLFSALAQLSKKAQNTKSKTAQKEESFRVVKNEIPQSVSIDHTFELERQIITILIMYGDREETFKESILSFSEEEEIEEEIKEVKVKVFEKIFLDLQQDEIELANSNFKTLFYLLIQHFQIEGQISIDKLIPTLDVELSSLVSNILMNDEQHQLHHWEKKNIFVKSKDSQISQLVNETILTLRKLLIDKKIEELQEQVKDNDEHHAQILEDVMSYYQLKKVVSRKLNRVI